MSKLLCFTLFFGFAFAAQAQVIAFDTTHIDYGYLPQYTKDNKRSFKFTNTGTAPLIIESALGNCGGTVASYLNQLVMPNESAEIIVSYDTNTLCSFTKYVSVSTNAINIVNLKEAGYIRLKITGHVFKEISQSEIEALKE
jgi:hypothetical protein